MNAKKQIVFILDDVKDVLSILRDYLLFKLPNVEVYTFTTYNTMKKHPLLKQASLFIIDIVLSNNTTGDQVAMEIHRMNHSPFLFMSGLDYNYDSFEDSNLTYDFIKKPFDMKQTLNRIKVLLKVSETYSSHVDETTKLRISLRELFDYTNIYMVILSDEMIVKLCSYKLWKDLGYNSESEILGMDWNNFIPESEKHKMLAIHHNVIEDSDDYQNSMREITNKVITKSGSDITVKWFNSRIANSHTYTFSIGIPYNRKVTEADEIESIRAYWKYVVDKDETTLKALKSSVKENDANGQH